MKNVFKLGIAIITLLMTISSCEKIDDKPEEKNKPDGKALKSARNSKLIDKIYTKDVTIDTTFGWSEEITTPEGIQFTIHSQSLKDKDGLMITGEVTIEVIEIFSKADMLLTGMTTMGKLADDNRSMLISGGEFRLSAHQEGNPLAINAPIFMKVPVDNTGGADSEMTLFDIREDGDFDDDGHSGGFALGLVEGHGIGSSGMDIAAPQNVWEEKQDSTTPAQGGDLFIEEYAGVTYYTGFIDNFGWTNVDKFYSFSGPKTLLKVKAPEGYNETNCAIYLSYDGEESGLATLDSYLPDEEVFSEHYGQIPVGLEVHVIAVSIVDDVYYYSIKSATIAEDQTITLDDLQPTTEVALTNEVNDLP